MLDLYERLLEYSEGEDYPFHMPGHKRLFGTESRIPYEMDITEISGFDNLHAPEEGGVLFEMYEQARKAYGTVCSFPLINGSTSGIMAAISACVNLEDEIIIARNCHKSVYRTCELLGLETHYIYPKYYEKMGMFGNINVDELEEQIMCYPESKAVVVTSPTYEGVILDIHRIAQIVHQHNMILIVDEAHGAHLPFAKREKSAIANGADLVIQSLHKTLPALTQTAMLHFCKEGVNRKKLSLEKVKEYVSLYQSSSPSYILMASIAKCLNACEEWSKRGAFDKFYEKIAVERRKYENLTCIHLFDKEDVDAFDYDCSRFVFVCDKEQITGEELFVRLRDDYQLECEMASLNYVTAIVSICDSDVGFERLRKAIFDIDQMLAKKRKMNKGRKDLGAKGEEEVITEADRETDIQQSTGLQKPNAVMSLRQAMNQQAIAVDVEKLRYQLENDYVKTSTLPFSQVYHANVAGNYVMIYPPGIPLIAPGEEYTEEIVNQIRKAKEQGLTVIGLQDGKVSVI